MSTAHASATGAVDGSLATPPRWRGRLHLMALGASLPAGAWLLLLADGLAEILAGGVFALALCVLFAVSSSYHLRPWRAGLRRWIKALDHSMIFVFTVSTNAAVAVLALDPPWGLYLLAALIGGAALGIALKLLDPDADRRVTDVLYLAVGWGGVAILPRLLAGLDVPQTVLLFGGGVCYTAGAVVLSIGRPDPAPRVFGYHEVGHSLMLAGQASHYAVIALLLAG
ncbi:MAG: PAQR family membrane homeostasis protein TrhA [Egibacteraceae bacterium]